MRSDAQEAADSPDAATGRESELKRTALTAVRRFYAAIVSGNLDALAESLTSDVIYEFPLSESGSSESSDWRRFDGRDAVVEFWRQTLSKGMQFNKPEDVEISLLGDGSRLFVEQRGNITLQSGKAYRNRYIFRYDIRDGKIARVREYINPIISAEAFGRPIGRQ